MKKNILIGMIACVGLTPIQAQTFSISEFSIPAGGTADVDICLDCESNKWGAFQFDLVLPTGIHVFEDEEGFYYDYTDRLTYKSGRVTKYFNVSGRLQNDGIHYRVVIDNGDAKTITGTSGPLLTIRLQADDYLDTDWVKLGMTGIVCTGSAGEGTVYPEDVAEVGRGMVRMDVVIGNTGWATFSWPRSCDFTDLPVEAYIGTLLGNDYLHLERVYNVRQNTGILLHGEPGTYHPSVGANLGHDYDDTSSNVLGQTAAEPLTAGNGNCYALTRHEGEIGFYPVREGVIIPQYRAYLPISASAEAPLFIGFEGLETVIEKPVATPTDDGIWYRLDGTRMLHPTKPGIYVKQGKKVKL